MSDQASDLMRQMRAEKQSALSSAKAAAATTTTDDAQRFYVRLLVLKLRRQQLIFAALVSFAVFSVIVARDYRKETPWWLTGLPIAAVGLMIALIPVSEEWEYKPWQARARQYERNQLNR